MKLLLIYNALSGKKDKIDKANYIKEKLEIKYDVDLYQIKKDESIKDYIINLNIKYDIFISLGGDGTLNSVINGVIRLNYDPIIGVIPFGTINDMASNLSIPKDIDKAIDIILNLHTENKKIYKINDYYMVYASAIGMLTSTSFIKKKRFGILSYYFNALIRFFKDKNIKIDIDSENIHIKANAIIFTSSNHLAGYKINKGNDLCISIIKGIKLLYPLRFYLFLKRGKAYYSKKIENINIDVSQNIMNIDGEEYKNNNKIDISFYKNISFISNNNI